MTEARKLAVNHLLRGLGVAEDSVLKSRDLRNHLEHSDERLDDTCAAGLGKIDTSVGPSNFIAGADPRMYLRFFDTTKFAINYRGVIFELRPIWDAIETLAPVAFVESQKRSN